MSRALWVLGRVILIALVANIASTAVLQAAPPSVTALFPSGGQVGQTVEVTAQGALGDKPQARFSRDGLKIEFAESGSKFKISIADGATPGLAWIRFFNAEGTSALRPFVIGTLPEVQEKEPNNAFKEAHKLEGSQTVVNGVLGKNGDVDTFAVSLKGGQTVVASLTAKRQLGSPMDGVLQLLGPRGFVLEHNDDRHGLDPQIVFTAPEDGEYKVRVFAFPEQPNSSVVFHGGANYIYRLTLTTGAFVDHALPMSVARGQSNTLRVHGWNIPAEFSELPLDSTDRDWVELQHRSFANVLTLPVESRPTVVEQPLMPGVVAQELSVPASFTGTISHPGEVDSVRFKLVAKQAIVIRSDARTSGSLLDPVLKIFKPDGSSLQELDDGAKGDFDPDANITAPADGEYRVAISDRFGFGGPEFFYRLSFIPAQPEVEFKLASDSFALSADKPLEIPVTIDRQRGFAHEVEFFVTGLPEKVTAEPVVSKKEGDTAKSVKLVLKTEAGVAFTGPIRVRARIKSEPPTERVIPSPVAATLEDLWLTVK